jgi:hypothetical protein
MEKRMNEKIEDMINSNWNELELKMEKRWNVLKLKVNKMRNEIDSMKKKIKILSF